MLPKPTRRLGLAAKLFQPSRIALVALNLLAYVLLFRWAAENIQADRLADSFRVIPGWALLGALTINCLVLVMCGVRMSWLMNRDFRPSFSIINIGYALNTLLPLRLGEPIKIYVCHRLFKIPLTGIFAASVAEKLFDLVLAIALVAAVLGLTAAQLIQLGTLISLCVLTLVALLAIFLFQRYVVQIVKLLPKGSRLRRISIELHKHARGYRIGRILAVSSCIWALNVFLVYFSFNTFTPDLHISMLEAATLLIVMALAIAIPSAPAGLGLFEAGIVAYLTQKSGICNETALAIASVFHLVITLPQVLIATKLLWGRKIMFLNSMAKIND